MVVVPVVGVCLWADDYEVGDAKGPKCRILPRVFITMQCHPPPTFPLAAPISAGRTDGANSEVVNLLLEKGADVAARDKVNALTLTKSLAAPRPPARGSASTASCIYSRIYSFEHIIILMHNAPRTLHNEHINFAYKLEHKWR